MRIFHLALESDWQDARQRGAYTVSTVGHDVADVGFIHCSRAEQVAGVHARFYRDVAEPLVLLTIDTELLTSPWQLDPVAGQQQTFPHVYGALNLGAIVSVTPFTGSSSDRCGKIERMTEKPEIDFIEGPAPTELQVTDLVIGDGAEAQPGGVVDVHYVGVEFDTGEQFDASWDRGQSAKFPLPQLIPAWQQGIPGMKVGGRRQLVCPPELAYGPAGGGHRLSGKTLVFVIDLLGV